MLLLLLKLQLLPLEVLLLLLLLRLDLVQLCGRGRSIRLGFGDGGLPHVQVIQSQRIVSCERGFRVGDLEKRGFAVLARADWTSKNCHHSSDMASFTVDWFTTNIPGIEQSLRAKNAVGPMRLLEIGAWEGMSTLYWLQTLHKDSHITVIDSFQGGSEHQEFWQLPAVEATFRANIAPHKDRVTVLKGLSQHKLFELTPDSFDIVYVDGSHASWDALSDVVMSFHLLKVGGLMVIDDYSGGHCDRNGNPNPPSKILENSPQPAVDAFLFVFARFVQVIRKEYQVHLIKVGDPSQ